MIQLDLRLRYPKKYYFSVEDYFLVFREPSFQDVELIDSISGNRISGIHKALLRFIDWNDDNLDDILNFIDTLPFRCYVYLFNSLGQLFQSDFEIHDEDFENLNYDSLSPIGQVNNVLGFRKNFVETKKTFDLFNMTMETLGVYIKAVKPFESEENESPKSQSKAWVPLSQMINPSGYESIQKNLIYEEPETDKNLTNDAKKEKLKENDKINQTNEKILLYTLNREEFVKMIYENANVGYLKAASKGINQRAYMSALERGIDPLVRDDRTKLINDQKNQTEKTPITIKSRWKGGK